MLFEDQVVSGSDSVMLVGLEALASVVNVDVVLLELLQNVDIDRGGVNPYLRPWYLWQGLLLQVEPWVLQDLWDRDSLVGVRRQYPADQVLCLSREEIGHVEVRREDLFVQIARVRVFEGQVASQESE